MEQQNHGTVCCDRLPPDLCAKYPWLVAECREDDGPRDHYFYNIHDDPLSHYQCRIPELLGKCIRGFFHGWVILSSNVMWFLWNPITSKIIRLPPLHIFKDENSVDDIRHCCLTSPLYDPSSILLLTITNKPTFVFCRLGRKRRWREMSYAKQLKKITIDGGLLHSLTCCNGKVYALNTDGTFADFVIQIDILVNDGEVEIKLLLFGSCPRPRYLTSYVENRHDYYFLKGSSTKLFCILVAVLEKTIIAVTLFKLDMTSVTWEELERLKDWDMTNKRVEELQGEDIADLDITKIKWEEMSDLKDAIFFLDLDRDCSIFYNPAIASELGGYIHIRGETGNTIFSYHVKYKTIVPSTIPFPLTSHVSMWEYRLEDDYGEAKCIVDSKQQEDEIVVRLATNDDDVGFNGSRLLNIPFDVLEMIMKFCVGVEYMNFRATCKQCHLAAPVIQWRNETSLTKLQNYSLVSPWLMVLDKNRGIITFTDPMLGDNYFMKNSQVSIAEGSKIYCSRFGWLLLKINETLNYLVLFNPFTKNIYNLRPTLLKLEGLCFSAPPTSPDCMVVGFTSYDGQWRATIFYVARDCWRTINLGDDLNSNRFPEFCGRDLYALCNEGKVIIFKHLLEEHHSLELIKAKVPGSCCKSEVQYYLMKCDQHLVLVIVGKFGKPIEVFKLNDSTEEWEKIDGLGKHMIYICGTTSLFLDAKTPEMENKIYFPSLHPTNGKIMFYSLQTCMFHTFDGRNIQQHLGGLFRTVHHHNPLAWIEPSWS